MAYLLFHKFRFPRHHLGAQVAFRAQMSFWAEASPVQVEVQRFLCTSSVSADSLQYHLGVEGSWLYVVFKPLPGVLPSQPSPSDGQENQLLISSLLRLRREVS
jgi:hypothetical protein